MLLSVPWARSLFKNRISVPRFSGFCSIDLVSAGLPFCGRIRNDGVDGDCLRHRCRDRAIQRRGLFAARGTAIRPRPHLVPHDRSLYSHVHFQSVDAGLGRPRRDRTGTDVFRDAGRRARGGEHGAVFAPRRSLERPADFQRP